MYISMLMHYTVHDCIVIIMIMHIQSMLKVHSSTKHTPFELVFGQPPRSVVVPDARLKECINEKDLELSVPTGEMESAQDTS